VTKNFYRFKPSDDGQVDYFDENGQSAKKFLMKTPINGARLSSGFGNRKHPILGYTKLHKGTDFAAPRGTPIYAAGNGVVQRAGPNSTYGNYIRVKHANGYETAYAHLNGYAKGIKKGVSVRQGQVIGYVGTTGQSTGPHLHYEVYISGKAVNAMRLKLPTGRKLAGEQFDLFKAERDRIDAIRAAESAKGQLVAEAKPVAPSLQAPIPAAATSAPDMRVPSANP
jgi:murein DD-endopeptidase MepM/ murein hydrolase activator NlpD